MVALMHSNVGSMSHMQPIPQHLRPSLHSCIVCEAVPTQLATTCLQAWDSQPLPRQVVAQWPESECMEPLNDRHVTLPTASCYHLEEGQQPAVLGMRLSCLQLAPNAPVKQPL